MGDVNGIGGIGDRFSGFSGIQAATPKSAAPPRQAPTAAPPQDRAHLSEEAHGSSGTDSHPLVSAMQGNVGRTTSIDVPQGASSGYRGTAGDDVTRVQSAPGSTFNYQTSPGRDKLDFQGSGRLDMLVKPDDNIVASDKNGPFFRQGDPNARNVTEVNVGEGAQFNVKPLSGGASQSQANGPSQSQATGSSQSQATGSSGSQTSGSSQSASPSKSDKPSSAEPLPLRTRVAPLRSTQSSLQSTETRGDFNLPIDV